MDRSNNIMIAVGGGRVYKVENGGGEKKVKKNN